MTALVFLEQQKNILNSYNSNSLQSFPITFTFFFHVHKSSACITCLLYTHTYIQCVFYKKFSIQNPFMLNVVNKRRKNLFLPFSIIWASVRSRTATHEWYLTMYLLFPASCYCSFSPTTRDLVLICAISLVGNLVAVSFIATLSTIIPFLPSSTSLETRSNSYCVMMIMRLLLEPEIWSLGESPFFLKGTLQRAF